MQAFQLPVVFDFLATFALGLSGTLAGLKRNYDVVGVSTLALVCGLGGGLLRDGIFIQQGTTPLLTDPLYIEVIAVSVITGVLAGRRLLRHTLFFRVDAMIDALGLGAYAAFGVQKSLLAGLSVSAALLVGVINAVGGGILRDVLTRQEPQVFRPGQLYIVIAFTGAALFALFRLVLQLDANLAAILAVGLTFVFRMLSLWCGWQTRPL